MKALHSINPTVATKFEEGKFTVQRSSNVFSSMAIDHAHEQNNKWLKGDGGIIGLTESTASLTKWMLAGPELLRVITEFESGRGVTKADKTSHHEQSPSSQTKFKRDVAAVVASLDELGNPFEEEGNDLISLSSKVICDKSVSKTVCEIKKIGQDMYRNFVHERITTHAKPITDVIHRNRLPLFTTRQAKTKVTKLTAMKNDVRLFSRLYISCQTRSGNMDTFFAHENQPYPPSLSDLNGCLRHGMKSELLQCIEKEIEIPVNSPSVSAVVLDGAAIVQMLNPRTSKNFLEYSQDIFNSYLLNYLKNCKRIDIVWDQYLDNSLKQQTRDLRGKGIRRRVSAEALIPSNWQSFLRVDDNKRELFAFLSRLAVQIADKDVVATLSENVLCSQLQDCDKLMPCIHEEADTRMIVHCADAAIKGHTSILIRTVDSDVVAIAVSSYESINADELWIGFGTGKHFRYIPVHEIVVSLGPQKARCLAMFHAFSGCDTVSSFAGRGKRTAWNTWKAFPEVTEAFLYLSNKPAEISDDSLKLLERFTVLLYDRTSSLLKVNECRKTLFAKKNRLLEAIPPTQDALIQHSLRALYQGGHVWGQSAIAQPIYPDPTKYGWTKEEGTFKPLWSTLSSAAVSCEELISCGCKKNCKGQCKCFRAALPCTSLCACDGECVREDAQLTEQIVEEDQVVDNIVDDFFDDDVTSEHEREDSEISFGVFEESQEEDNCDDIESDHENVSQYDDEHVMVESEVGVEDIEEDPVVDNIVYDISHDDDVQQDLN